MKKIILLSFTLLFVGFIPHVFAEGFVPLVTVPGLTDVQPTSGGLADFFNNLYKYLIGVAAILAVIEIIWGGLEISTQDSVSKNKDGKERIYNAIFGLVLVLSPVLVFSIINPSILNLSLNLEPLKTTTGTGGGGETGVQAPAVDAATTAATVAGCTVTGTLIKTAKCPTQQAAQDFATACTTGSGNVPFFTAQYGIVAPNAVATCDTRDAGPYSFADTSTGILATLTGYSRYEPLASTPTNPNNGNDVLQFASACTAEKGTTCMSPVKLPCASSVVQLVSGGGSVSCWNISLSCTDGNTGAGGCSSSPQFTIIK